MNSHEIAIIGMACRFPGADTIEEFWNNLISGIESITPIVKSKQVNSSNYVGVTCAANNIDKFDANFFGITPREAEITDPQHRLLLECAYEALEHAAYDPDNYTGRIGVYTGIGISSYLIRNVLTNHDLLQSLSSFQILLHNDKDFAASKIAYKLNLTGPCMNIGTACSSSLVAVHQACSSLLAYECDMALAGAAKVDVPYDEGYYYEAGGIHSPDGHCHAFDDNAQGTIFGSGAGIIVLKRLQDALNDGDYIHAIIKGSAINNDGASKIGYTAPSTIGQANVIAEALNFAEVSPDTISYVEAHGTGTHLGDPIEIAALTEVFQASKKLNRTCSIGSVKTNIGHLDVAAGIAGLIKTVQALKYHKLPPSLNYKKPNSRIDFANSPFYVQEKLTQWPKPIYNSRRAGVSSFGIGGTNAHIVLEEAPLLPRGKPSHLPQLLVLSAKTPTALELVTDNLIVYLKNVQEVRFDDIAYTLQVGRKKYDYRRIVACDNFETAINSLQLREPNTVFTSHYDGKKPSIVFMFPGQGGLDVQAWTVREQMLSGLYKNEPVFRAKIEECANLLFPFLGINLCDVLYPSEDRRSSSKNLIQQTWITEPALFSLEYALACLWGSYGIVPDIAIGDSIGEYVAACLAGVFSLNEALELVALRGKLLHSLPLGSSIMDPILNSFAECIAKFKLNAPKFPFISNVTGKYILSTEATNPRYWVKQLQSPVSCDKAIKVLLQETNSIFLQIGPKQRISQVYQDIVSAESKHDERSDQFVFLEALGRLWLNGITIHWRENINEIKKYRVPLPTYPFERLRYWIDPKFDLRSHTKNVYAEAKNINTQHNEVERKILSIWQKFLGIEQITVHDSLFELGGDSVIAIQIATQIRVAFAVEFSLAEFYKNPTISGIAKTIYNQSVMKVSEQHLGEKVKNNQLVPLSYPQQRLWFLYQLNNNDTSYNMSTLIKINGHLSINIFNYAFNEIVRRHASLRTIFTEVNGHANQAILDHMVLEIPIEDLSNESLADGSLLEQRIQMEIQKSFDLSRGPLIRIKILIIDQEEYYVILCMHHIITDGWSMHIFVKEFMELYSSAYYKKEANLAELPVQYYDFAHWQRQWLTDNALQIYLDYWKTKLINITTGTEFPINYKRPNIVLNNGETISFLISPPLLESLKQIARENSSSLFMVLLTGFKMLLQYYCKQDDIIIGTDIAGRDRQELETLIGFFVNQLVLCTNLGNNPNFIEVLSRVKTTTLEAYSNQAMPFDLLVNNLKNKRELNRTPLFQIKFVLQNYPTKILSLPNMELNVLELKEFTAKYDILLNMVENKDGLKGFLQYRSDLFTSSIMNQLVKCFNKLFYLVTDNPNITVCNLAQFLNEYIHESNLEVRQQTSKKNIQKLKLAARAKIEH